MTEAVPITEIEAIIRRRAARRHAHVNLERMRYANECMFERIPPAACTRSLYVGVGHGHDALLALLDGHLESVVGVDPYHADDGNDEEDLVDIQQTIEMLGLQNRFTVVQARIEDYIQETDDRFTCIVLSDVLHHIYVTEKSLRDDACFPDAVRLFQDMHGVTEDDGALVIREATRRGLRPLLTKIGILAGDVDYTTKQVRQEWINAAAAGDWRPTADANYIPWRFRNQADIWSGALGSVTLCDKYFLWFTHS